MSFNNGNSSLSASICAPQSHSHCAISSSFSVTAVCVCAFVISRNVLPVAFWIASCIAFEGILLAYFFSFCATHSAAEETVCPTFSSLSSMISLTHGCDSTMRWTAALSPSSISSRSVASLRLSLWRFESAAQGSFSP